MPYALKSPYYTQEQVEAILGEYAKSCVTHIAVSPKNVQVVLPKVNRIPVQRRFASLFDLMEVEYECAKAPDGTQRMVIEGASSMMAEFLKRFIQHGYVLRMDLMEERRGENGFSGNES